MGPIDRILRQGIELGVSDYVAILEFYTAARTILGTGEYDPVEILGAVFDKLVDEDMVVPGALGATFSRWSDGLSPREVKDRLRIYLGEHGTWPESGFEIWFDLTEKGRQLAREVSDEGME